jgi:general secretion pathway protein K
MVFFKKKVPRPRNQKTFSKLVHRGAGSERGFALLIVLWSLVLIGLLITQVLATGRTATMLAYNLRAAAAARAGADGAINEAMFHVLSYGPNHWAPDGTPHVLDDAGLTITVRVASLGGKINPNLASTGLLAGLFQAVGAAPGQAAQLANAIIAWRSPAASKHDTQALLAAYRRAGLRYGPPGHAFSDLSELRDVIGMQPALLAAALPHMSLYQSGDPNPALADAQVRRALVLAGQGGAAGNVYDGTSPVVSIDAEAEGPDHLSVHRRAIVSLPGADAAVPFQFLSLTED